MRWSSTGTVSQNSLTFTFCMRKYVAMLSLLKGCTENDFPIGIVRLDECLFFSISECGRLVRYDEETKDLATRGSLEHPSLKRRCWNMLRHTPLQLLVVLHVKRALRKVACGEYSMNNHYTYHPQRVHVLLVTDFALRVAFCEPLQRTNLRRPLLRMSPTAGDETSRGRNPENLRHTDRPRPSSPELFNKDQI